LPDNKASIFTTKTANGKKITTLKQQVASFFALRAYATILVYYDVLSGKLA